MGYKKVDSLDTNAVLRFVLRDVPEQYTRVARLFTRPDVMYRIDSAVFIEAVYVMQRPPYSLSRKQVRLGLIGLFKTSGYRVGASFPVSVG